MLRYNKDKVKQAIRFLLTNDYEISFREVLQYLYLIDMHYYQHENKSFTNDIMIKTKQGVILKNTLYHLLCIFKFRIKTVHQNTLNNREKQIIQNIYNQYRGLIKTKYIEMCHIDETDKLIDIRDIIRFWDLSAEEIKQVKKDLIS